MSRIFGFLFTVLVGFANIQAQKPKLNSPADVDKLPASKGDTIYYGLENQNYGILRKPAKIWKGESYPIIILIHGGCWYSPYAQTKNTEAIATKFTKEFNAFTWNIEYRQFDNGGGFPNTFIDIAKALDHVRELAFDYPIDTTNITVYGHSAGGHLAIWAAARPKVPFWSETYVEDPLPIHHVVGVGSICDLVAFDEIEEETCGIVCVSKLMGGSRSEVPRHYQAGNPPQLLPIQVPISLITGEFDRIVPKSHGDNFQFSARGRGDNVYHYYVEKAGHHEYNDPNSVVWPILKGVIKRKLKKK